MPDKETCKKFSLSKTKVPRDFFPRQRELESLTQRKREIIKKGGCNGCWEFVWEKNYRGKTELQRRLIDAGSTLTKMEFFVLWQTKKDYRYIYTKFEFKSWGRTHRLIVKLKKEIKTRENPMILWALNLEQYKML